MTDENLIPRSPADERHFSAREIAEIWKLSPKTIQRLFKDEPGVFRVVRPGTGSKREYVTLRIPKSVMERVHKRMTRPTSILRDLKGPSKPKAPRILKRLAQGGK
jgi:hypothetical protein